MLAEHMLAYVDCMEGEFESALDRRLHARRFVYALNAKRFLMNNRCCAAMSLSGLGRHGEALDEISQAEDVARLLGVTWVLPWQKAERATCEPTHDAAVKALEVG